MRRIGELSMVNDIVDALEGSKPFLGLKKKKAVVGP